MRAMNERRALLVAAVVAFSSLHGHRAAADDDVPPTPPATLREESPFGPAAALEVGAGVVWPSVAAPLIVLHGRIGVSYSATPRVTLAFGAESGLGLALSGSSPSYGYMLRLPIRGFTDFIISRVLDYRSDRFVNLHLGGSVGSDFVLSSQCSNGSCSYLPPGNYAGFGLRAGASLTQGSSGAGAFVRWDNDVGSVQACTGGTTRCTAYIQMYTWNIGWTFF